MGCAKRASASVSVVRGIGVGSFFVDLESVELDSLKKGIINKEAIIALIK